MADMMSCWNQKEGSAYHYLRV